MNFHGSERLFALQVTELQLNTVWSLLDISGKSKGEWVIFIFLATEIFKRMITFLMELMKNVTVLAGCTQSRTPALYIANTRMR